MKKIAPHFFRLLFFCLLVSAVAFSVPKASASSSMTTSASCIEFIKAVEGFSATPYYDYNQYTVGYGTRCPSDKYAEYTANGISKKEAEALLRDFLADIEDTISKKLMEPYSLTFTQNEFDALVSFSYNIGTGWMTYDSTLRNAILRNASDNELVYAFGLYCTAGGKYLPSLITRRLCEANMYLNGVYSKTIDKNYGYVYYDANGGTLTYRVQGYICDSSATPAANAAQSGDVFLGWYTELNGGTEVTTLTRELSGKTLFAHWQSSDNQASDSVTVKVTGDVVNLRSGPGTNYGIQKQVKKGTVLTVSHITHLTTMKWGKTPDGWICLDYTNYDDVVGNTGSEAGNTPSEDTSAPDDWNDSSTNKDPFSGSQQAVTGIVNVNDFLKIRNGPGTTYETVGFLFNNERVEILEQKTSGTMVWGRIKNGWVCMNYIVTDNANPGPSGTTGTAQDWNSTPSQGTSGSTGSTESITIKGKITADALRIRSGAGTSNKIVGFYYQNDSVMITEKVLYDHTYWGKTSKGWISMDYVQVDSSSVNSGNTAATGRKTVTADCLRIRKGAGTDYKIAGLLYYGDTVTVLDTTTVNGTVWGRVSEGWICMNYVS